MVKPRVCPDSASDLTENRSVEATSYICRIVVTTGPDRGKVFEVDEELIHIGRADENQIVLEDPSLPDHQASILRKNGRFAIFRPTDADVQVDGADIPIEKWVWLPNDVRLQFGRRTSCQLSYEATLDDRPASTAGPSAAPDAPKASPSRRPGAGPSPVPAKADSGNPDPSNDDAETSLDQSRDGSSAGGDGRTKKSRRKSKAAKRKKNVARFITDQGGPLVELGADGHLPELALQDDPARKEKQARPSQSNSSLLYSVLALSFLSSLAMLFAEVDPPSVSELSKADAREEIVRFFGSEDQELQSWQKQLRAARLAHSRGDSEAELMAYRRVLALLKSEDRDPHIGITGHLATDEELKRLIGIIISR